MQKNNNIPKLDDLKNIQFQLEQNLILEDIYAKYNAKRNLEKRIHLSFVAILCLSIGMQVFTLSSFKKQTKESEEYNTRINLSIY
jgi:uncharacterized PurR-regulated membrane protein YhhQ (DUF165 family)